MRSFLLVCLLAVAWCQEEVFEGEKAPTVQVVVLETPPTVADVPVQAVEAVQNNTVETTTIEEARTCACQGGQIPAPRIAEAVLNSLLSALSVDAHKDVSPYFVSGAAPAFFADTFSLVDQAVFKVPDYVISSQNSVVAKVAWSYTLKESGQEYDDGLLVIVLKTDPITNLVNEFRAVHENENFLNRLPKPLPVTVHELVENFLNGINSLSQRDSLAYIRNNFVLTFRGQTSLLPADFDTTVTLATFTKFQEDFRAVFGVARKSLSCALVEEIGTTAVFECRLLSKYAKVRTCLDLLVTAESEEGLLKTIDIYVDGTCQSEELKRIELEQQQQKARKEEEKRVREEQKRTRDEEKRVKDEETKRVKEETRRVKDELKRQKEEETRKQKEEELRRLQEEEAVRRVKEEEDVKRAKEEEAKKREDEIVKQRVDEELAKQKEEKKKGKQGKESKRK